MNLKKDLVNTLVRSSAKAQNLYLNTLKSSAKEILLIFPTNNALVRNEKIGVIQLSKEAAKERRVKVRILTPTSKLTQYIIQSLKQQQNYIDVRYIEQTFGTEATILVIDRKVSLVMELKDDSKATFVEAIGLSTRSNSKAGVLSYVAVFDSLWKQSELYQAIKESHEQT